MTYVILDTSSFRIYIYGFQAKHLVGQLLSAIVPTFLKGLEVLP